MQKTIKNNCKKAVSIMLVLAMIFSANFALVSKARAAAYTVDTSGAGDYTTISAAITAAAPGDTINVNAGTYTENVVVNKALTIVGVNKATTIINTTADKTKVNLEISSPNVTISGFTVNGNDGTSVPGNITGDKAVYIHGADNIDISNFLIQGGTQYDNTTGLYLTNTNNGNFSFIDIKTIDGKTEADALKVTDGLGGVTANNFDTINIDGIVAHTSGVSGQVKALRIIGAGVVGNNFDNTTISNLSGINAAANIYAISLESNTGSESFSNTVISGLSTTTGNSIGIYNNYSTGTSFNTTTISGFTGKNSIGVQVLAGDPISLTGTTISGLTGTISAVGVNIQEQNVAFPTNNVTVTGGSISSLTAPSATGLSVVSTGTTGVTGTNVSGLTIDMGPAGASVTTGIYVNTGSSNVIQNNTINNADVGIKLKDITVGAPIDLTGNVLGSGVTTFIDGTGTTVAVNANNVTFQGIVSAADLAARLVPAGGGAIVAIDTTAPAQPVIATQYVQSNAIVNIPVVNVGDHAWLAPAATTIFATGLTMTKVDGDGAINTMNAPTTAGTYYLYLLDDNMNVSTASINSVTVDNTAPTATKLGNGTVNYSIANTVSVNLVFSETISGASKLNVEAALTAGSDQILTYLWNGTDDTLNITNNSGATANFPGDIIASISDLAGNNTGSALLVDSAPVTSGGGGGGGGGTYYAPPSNTSIIIDNGNTKTSSRTVTLTLGANGATSMAISNDAGFSSSVWETYSTTKQWTLTSGNGTKTIYVKYKNIQGSTSNAVSSSIILENQSTNSVPDTGIKAILGKCPASPVDRASSLGLTSSQVKFYRDLGVGSVSTDSRLLQRFLNANGYTVLALESNTFTRALSTSLARFQAKYGLGSESGFLGARTRAFLNSLGNPSYDYELINQSAYPSTLKPGQETDVWIEVKNTGTATWYNNCTNAVRLGAGSSYGNSAQQRDYASEFANSTWLSSNRPVDIMHPEIIPGWHTRFQFKIKAPITPGTYKAYFTPVADGITWMKDIGIYWEIKVQ